MTDKEAMKLALDALKDTHYRIISAGLLDQDLLNRNFTVATALRERLAQPAPVQEPVAGHIGWLVRNSQGKFDLLTELQIDSSLEKYERLHKLYTHPPQRTEQNFCSRCGKRTPDLITIHTCTPPKD